VFALEACDSSSLDDAYFSDTYDLFREAKQARVVANQTDGKSQFSSKDLLAMLTRAGARTLNVETEIGSIEPGKKADMILLDIESSKYRPLPNLPALVVSLITYTPIQPRHRSE
jgi:5-methylthioadenosine/S-adenosylhomocysteine deaminase